MANQVWCLVKGCMWYDDLARSSKTHNHLVDQWKSNLASNEIESSTE